MHRVLVSKCELSQTNVECAMLNGVLSHERNVLPESLNDHKAI